MRLTVEMALHGVAHALREQIAPALDDPFAVEAARLAALLAAIAANGADDAAMIRVQENARMRALFAAASSVALDDRTLADTLAEASTSIDPGLRLSQLDAENGRLRHLLVQLHAVIEEQASEPARVLDRAIWQMLRDTESARAPRF